MAALGPGGARGAAPLTGGEDFCTPCLLAGRPWPSSCTPALRFPLTDDSNVKGNGGEMVGKRLSLFALVLLAACAGGGPDRMAADSLSRDLQRAPVDSSAVLDDHPAARRSRADPAPAPKPVATKPKPKPAPKPAPLPSQPAPGSRAPGTRLGHGHRDRGGAGDPARRREQGGRDDHHQRQLRRDRLARASGHSRGIATVNMTITRDPRVGEQGRQDRQAHPHPDGGRDRGQSYRDRRLGGGAGPPAAGPEDQRR